MSPETLRVLEAADRHGQWEQPDGFDHHAALRRFNGFLAELEQRLAELEETYPPTPGPSPGGWTWWIRYFDYL